MLANAGTIKPPTCILNAGELSQGQLPCLGLLCNFPTQTMAVRVVYPSCTAEASQSRKGFQVFLECLGPRIQMVKRREASPRLPDGQTVQEKC